MHCNSCTPTRVVIRSYFLVGLTLVFLLSVSFAVVAADDGGDVCGPDQSIDPQLVSTNCRFEGKGNPVEPYGLIRPYWNPFVISGSPHFDTLDTHNAYGWLPDHQGDQKIETFGKPWSAGIWQRVPNVVAGHGYKAEAGWVISQNTLAEGRIGIDPTGGSDPLSPKIVWSKPILVCSALRCRHQVQAYAANSVISVWVQVTITTTIGPDNAWISAVGVKADSSMAAATTTATATSRPTAMNTRVPPTRTPVPSATGTATPTMTATATATEAPSSTATASPTATTTATATATASATGIPKLTAQSPTTARALEATEPPNSVATMGSIVATVMVFAAGLAVIWVRRRRP